jgi:hypothetical protein
VGSSAPLRVIMVRLRHGWGDKVTLCAYTSLMVKGVLQHDRSGEKAKTFPSQHLPSVRVILSSIDILLKSFTHASV